MDPSHTWYSLLISRSGLLSCDCPDFTSCGGACKHLRALCTYIEYWISLGHEQSFSFPASKDEACKLLPPQPGGLLPSSTNHVPVADLPLLNLTMLQTLGNNITTLDETKDMETPATSPESSSTNSDDGLSPLVSCNSTISYSAKSAPILGS